MPDRPSVFKAAGVWLWSCDHGGPVGDIFHPTDWRDAWTAALAAASKHAVLYHRSEKGEDL
ncbi:hypothetical protein ABZ215_24965 [Amycolatopsis sp. NPDC006131]|uniref:hypothetical protein n=1 Tax=Amycolatopsis sp. NPDC006131 TaxID=3156731 RepID=UPI0033B09BE3